MAATLKADLLQRDPDALVSKSGIRDFFPVSDATIWRWRKDESLGFPPPELEINGREFWTVGKLLAFRARLAAERAAKPPIQDPGQLARPRKREAA